MHSRPDFDQPHGGLTRPPAQCSLASCPAAHELVPMGRVEPGGGKERMEAGGVTGMPGHTAHGVSMSHAGCRCPGHELRSTGRSAGRAPTMGRPHVVVAQTRQLEQVRVA